MPRNGSEIVVGTLLAWGVTTVFGQARIVQVDRDPQRIGLRQATEAGLVGDAKATLPQLLPLLQRKQDCRFPGMAQAETRRWHETLRTAEDSTRLPMNPAAPVAALGARMPPDAAVVADSGHHTGLVARHMRLGPGHEFGVSGLLASVACAIPYAVAAGCTWPGRPVSGVLGDGGLPV